MDLPQRLDRDTVARLERERSLILFNAGADGAYLLHAYVDEPVPDDLRKYCDIADRKIATLNVSGGPVHRHDEHFQPLVQKKGR